MAKPQHSSRAALPPQQAASSGGGEKKTCINEKCKHRNDANIRWKISKVIQGADICQACYRAEQVVLADKQCAMCDSRTTNGCWYRSKVIQGKSLCRKCYNKELTKLQNKICGACGSKETTASWYNSSVKAGVSCAIDVTIANARRLRRTRASRAEAIRRAGVG